MVLALVQQGLRTQCCSSDEENSAASLFSPPFHFLTLHFNHFSSPHSFSRPHLSFGCTRQLSPHPSLHPCLYAANVIHVLCSSRDLLRQQKRGIFTDQSDGVELCSYCTLTVARQSLLQQLQRHTGSETAVHTCGHLSHECTYTQKA